MSGGDAEVLGDEAAGGFVETVIDRFASGDAAATDGPGDLGDVGPAIHHRDFASNGEKAEPVPTAFLFVLSKPTRLYENRLKEWSIKKVVHRI